MPNGTLKQIIRESGLRQRWIAEQLGLSDSALSDFVRGVRDIPLDKIPPLAALLRITADELVAAYVKTQQQQDTPDV